MREAGAALTLLHGAGLFHRDVKPANLLVGADGQLKLADFGLARPLDGTLSAAGSPAFAAPEIIAGKPVSGVLADVYSLGATLAFLLTGETILPGRPDVFALERRSVPRSLQQAIVGATAADPRERTASVEAWLQALSRENRRIRPREVRLARFTLGANAPGDGHERVGEERRPGRASPRRARDRVRALPAGDRARTGVGRVLGVPHAAPRGVLGRESVLRDLRARSLPAGRSLAEDAERVAADGRSRDPVRARPRVRPVPLRRRSAPRDRLHDPGHGPQLRDDRDDQEPDAARSRERSVRRASSASAPAGRSRSSEPRSSLSGSSTSSEPATPPRHATPRVVSRSRPLRLRGARPAARSRCSAFSGRSAGSSA